MRIGIMSMQRVENYGSFLQAYGLKKMIESFGHTIEFVDYKVEASLATDMKENKKNNILIRLMKLLSPVYRDWRSKQIKMNKTFRLFCEKYRNVFLPQLGVTTTINISPELDVLVIGSDEVFNCTQAAERVGFSRQLFGADNNALRVISYAASFGSTTLDKLIKYNIDNEVASLLSNFNALSVRDENSREIINVIYGMQPEKHIDPVLLYDFPEVKDIQIDMNNYIIVYAYADRIKDKEAEIIKEFAQRNGKKIVSLGFYQPFCDEYILADPLEVLAYIKNADYVITDTFHGTIFSIKYQKKFATIIRKSNCQKLEDLLKQFYLEDRQIKDLGKLQEILDSKYDERYVRNQIISFQEEAKKYLKSNIIMRG